MSTAKKKDNKAPEIEKPRPSFPDDERLNHFCKAASHELGNVLGTIVGELDYGLTNTNTLVRYRAMNVALAAAERAISLARNLSFFATHAKLNLQPVDVSQLVLETVEMVEKDLRNRHIKFNVLVDTSRMLALDAGAFQQVLLNLFRRSSETMPQGGKLTLSMRLAASRVELTCSDTGVGIPKERLEAVLFPDTQNDNSLQVESLELAVAKTLIERQGGELKIQSTPGQGTAYTLSFPYDPQAIRPKPYTEHRRFRRVNTHLPVEVSFAGQSPFISEIQTLSVQGCFVALVEDTAKLPALDAIGALRIYYYQDQILDIAKCRIANQVRNGKTVGVGIEFIEFDSRARKLLEAIVKSHSF
ncbi:PilZ domain-containing protein [bacterium]|nr:PilZ domain-containing protein [bacterium]